MESSASRVSANGNSSAFVLEFMKYALDEFRSAVVAGDVPRQDRIGDDLELLVFRALETYGPQGRRETAFKVAVDSRVADA